MSSLERGGLFTTEPGSGNASSSSNAVRRTESGTYLVLVNAGAGAVLRATPENFAGAIQKGFAAHGVTANVKIVEANKIRQLASEFAQSSRPNGSDVLVIGGGDGTLGSVALILAVANLTLGILPLGTLNHLAKDLGIPQEVDAAIEVIAAGNTRKIDLAKVNGRAFVNNSSVGIYPFFVNERTAEQRRRGVGKFTAMIPALLRTLHASSWQRVTIQIEGDHRELRTPCVFVGNNLYDLDALGRRSDLSAGELCLYVVKQQTRLGLVLLPFKVALGLAHPERDVESFTVRSVSIHSTRGHLNVAIDGETAREPTPLNYCVLPGALTVLAPPNGKHEAPR